MLLKHPQALDAGMLWDVRSLGRPPPPDGGIRTDERICKSKSKLLPPTMDPLNAETATFAEAAAREARGDPPRLWLCVCVRRRFDGGGEIRFAQGQRAFKIGG